MVLNSASAGPVPDRCVLPKLDIAGDIKALSLSVPLTAPPPKTSRTEGLSVPHADVLNTCVVCLYVMQVLVVEGWTAGR